VGTLLLTLSSKFDHHRQTAAGLAPRHLRTGSVADAGLPRQASFRPIPRIQQPLSRIQFARGEGSGITTAVAVAALGAIVVLCALVALWAALRRRVDTRLTTALEQIDGRLAGIATQISSAARSPKEPTAGLGEAIGSTIELEDVLQRTLAAAEALPAVDGSLISVRRDDGTVATAIRGLIAEDASFAFGGPPDGTSYTSGIAFWETSSPDGLRTGLVVPLGAEGDGMLAVYSRIPSAFDNEEAEHVLRVIAQRAVPAVENALRYLEVQERAATDFRTGLGSASAFAEALPREISAARRHGRPLCLIQIDLDDFGTINRTHSLAVGDAVLTELGDRVRATIRASDSAFRNSGGADEFFLVLPETTREYAQLLYGRLAFEVAARPLAGVDPPVTMSSGLAELRADDTVESLLERAERAMTTAKRNNKNQLCTDADG
jgi:diguanylate cyclase (GGDEF)-like protein